MGDRIGVQHPLLKIYHSLTNHPSQLGLAIPLWVGAMSTGQRAVMLCDWGVKADMVSFAGNTVWSISEHIRGVCVDVLYKSMFTLLYYIVISQQYIANIHLVVSTISVSITVVVTCKKLLQHLLLSFLSTIPFLSYQLTTVVIKHIMITNINLVLVWCRVCCDRNFLSILPFCLYNFEDKVDLGTVDNVM